ncbi:hypothetical protein EVAR_39507_1 [Eumeta japonica]|uniref:Uncharacterized protein n=1 Tax=Eumeta variegata TaxID=151549 RepID=A0A4C1VYZ8_EUMVA|nr:hypothetical protein EVAR_39507_1 [Eumeta japonica]
MATMQYSANGLILLQRADGRRSDCTGANKLSESTSRRWKEDFRFTLKSKVESAPPASTDTSDRSAAPRPVVVARGGARSQSTRLDPRSDVTASPSPAPSRRRPRGHKEWTAYSQPHLTSSDGLILHRDAGGHKIP